MIHILTVSYTLHRSSLCNASSYAGVFRSNLMQQTGYSDRRCEVCAEYTAPPGTIHTDICRHDIMLLDHTKWNQICACNTANDVDRHWALAWNFSKIYDKHNVNNVLILYLPLHIFYNINTFKYLNTWHCTSQIYILVLVVLCI
jgi:hypothetical protein